MASWSWRLQDDMVPLVEGRAASNCWTASEGASASVWIPVAAALRSACCHFEYEALRQRWDSVNRASYRDHSWSAEQREVLDRIKQLTTIEDEEQRILTNRFLYVKGPPGSGKSAVLLEAAIQACMLMSVLIVCPTGFLVHQYKSKLPDREGVDRIRVDTIQGVLNYKRSGSDSKVTWAPPSALRRYDLILLDEGSQYEDQEWSRFFRSVKEQPHAPCVCVVADFQQLQPVVSGGLCQQFCEKMASIALQTVYRSRDEEHLVFLNRIRDKQPTRARLQEYFGDRHWSRRRDLEDCVAEGMRLAEEADIPFTWLTVTNAGASEVCRAALKLVGLTEAELRGGYDCDPTSKSDLRIVAKPGVIIRLTRNFDKARGFVNGALAVVCESLRGNAVFTARLLGTNNMVLVHPMREGGAKFLPCCYGYATTIRRAQGADLHHGCVYFDQLKFAAARGYGYVACSRFKTRAGCYLYGKLRRSDFLPVGPDLEEEQLERGYESLSSDDEDGGGLEYAFDGAQFPESDEEGLDPDAEDGNLLADFEPAVDAA